MPAHLPTLYLALPAHDAVAALPPLPVLDVPTEEDEREALPPTTPALVRQTAWEH